MSNKWSNSHIFKNLNINNHPYRFQGYHQLFVSINFSKVNCYLQIIVKFLLFVSINKFLTYLKTL